MSAVRTDAEAGPESPDAQADGRLGPEAPAGAAGLRASGGRQDGDEAGDGLGDGPGLLHVLACV